MTHAPWWTALAAGVLLSACGASHPSSANRGAGKADPPRITQFYANHPQLARGEAVLLCYGVENAAAVEMTPSTHSLSAAFSRCVEESPAETTTYTLTAKGGGGQTVSRQVTVTVGAAAPKIVEVNVSSLKIHLGDPVSLCYEVTGSQAVTVEPLHYRGAPPRGCTQDQPHQTTTYVVIAHGAGGATDQERVTVTVQ